MDLPAPTDDLCFSCQVFLSEDYGVDEFLSNCRRKVTIEHLQQDLQSYYATLKAAMIELINKDYGDFLDLSANLVGMDKQIENITTPLSQLHQEVSAINASMTNVIKALENKMAARAEVRQQKVTLNRLVQVFDATEQLEMLLDDRKSGRSLDELGRVAMEFNKLRHNASLLSDHPTVQKLHSRMAAITERFQNLLEQIFVRSLSDKDHEQLLQVLEVYSLICSQSSAEELFCSHFIRPHLQKMVSSKLILAHPKGLGGVYADVLELVLKQSQFLFEVCNGIGPDSGFNFLVNGVWPELVSLLETKANVIFTAGNPDSFHKNYLASMEFLNQFESQCQTLTEVKRLRSHPSYSVFINKWSLPVYYQIRYQDIAGQLESQLELPLKEAEEGGKYSLQIFITLSDCLVKCWSNGIYLSSLMHRFWKLTLQLVIRLGVWLGEVLEGSEESCPVATSIKLDRDIQTFVGQSKEFLDNLVLPQLANKDIKETKLSESFRGACDTHLVSLLTRIGTKITSSLTQQCSSNLEPVHTIPRLYRRTNRDVPSKPSGYVGAIFKPLSAITGEKKVKWIEEIVNGVTEKYHEMTSDVLNNVKRTEDSLLKLKKNRRSLIPETTSGMSDDNKIRLQLSIDVEHYLKQVDLLLPVGIMQNMISLSNLKEMGLLAKTASLSNL